MRSIWSLFVLIPFVTLFAACGPANGGDPGNPAVAELPVTGTVFTIVFENHGVDAVINPQNPYIWELAQRYGTADAYLANTHPSLPNYIEMTSGTDHGIADDNFPASHPIAGNDNLADQLDAGGITWRAYMEAMGEPCKLEDNGTYNVKHDPFAYYTSLTSDRARCEEHVVDFDTHFAEDLAANTYQYMWITPDICNDMHDCPTSTGDAWLSHLIPMIMDSPGYKEGGVIFIMFDEGDADATYAWSKVFGRPQNIPFILISDNLVDPGFVSNTTYNHNSYLATIEDIFGLPRLETTVDAVPFSDFFLPDPWGNAVTDPAVPTTPALPTDPGTTAP